MAKEFCMCGNDLFWHKNHEEGVLRWLHDKLWDEAWPCPGNCGKFIAGGMGRCSGACQYHDERYHK